MPGKFPFAYLNGSWVPQQLENKGQDQEPVTRPCPYAKTWYSGKLVSVSFRNTTQRTAVPREHPKTDTVVVDFFSLLNFFLYCFFSSRPAQIFMSYIYFHQPLKKEILKTTNCHSFSFGFAISIKDKGSVRLSFLIWKVCLENLA